MQGGQSALVDQWRLGRFRIEKRRCRIGLVAIRCCAVRQMVSRAPGLCSRAFEAPVALPASRSSIAAVCTCSCLIRSGLHRMLSHASTSACLCWVSEGDALECTRRGVMAPTSARVRHALCADFGQAVLACVRVDAKLSGPIGVHDWGRAGRDGPTLASRHQRDHADRPGSWPLRASRRSRICPTLPLVVSAAPRSAAQGH